MVNAFLWMLVLVGREEMVLVTESMSLVGMQDGVSWSVNPELYDNGKGDEAAISYPPSHPRASQQHVALAA